MKKLSFLACAFLGAGVVSCGLLASDDEEVQLDPYRALMADRINAVLYTRRPPEKIMAKLGELGVQPGRLFGEFKSTTGIDDWFGEEWKPGVKRYTSLSCGLSPVVDDAGRMTAFYRNRKFIDGKMYPEIPLSPGLEAGE